MFAEKVHCPSICPNYSLVHCEASHWSNEDCDAGTTTIAASTRIFQRRSISSFGNDSKKKLLVPRDHRGKQSSEGLEAQRVPPSNVPKLTSTQGRKSLHQEAQSLHSKNGLITLESRNISAISWNHYPLFACDQRIFGKCCPLSRWWGRGIPENRQTQSSAFVESVRSGLK